MKRLLSLIMLVVILTVGIFISTPKAAFAFCVYNKAGIDIHGKDTRKGTFGGDKYWEENMASNAKGCCPGNNEECQNAEIRVTSLTSNGACEAQVDAHGWIVVHSNDSGTKLDCRVNEPV